MQPAEHFTASDTGAEAPGNAAQAQPQAAQGEEAKPATAAEKDAGAAKAADHSSGAGDKPRAKAQSHRGSNRSHAAGGDNASSDQPPRLQEQLLARLTVPPVTFDRRSLPANLIDALDAAGLGARETLPAAALMSLATVAAVAGPAVRCEIGGDHALIGAMGDTALRVALIAQDRRASLVPSAILAGAHAAENDLLDRYDEAAQLDAEDRRAAADRGGAGAVRRPAVHRRARRGGRCHPPRRRRRHWPAGYRRAAHGFDELGSRDSTTTRPRCC